MNRHTLHRIQINDNLRILWNVLLYLRYDDFRRNLTCSGQKQDYLVPHQGKEPKWGLEVALPRIKAVIPVPGQPLRCLWIYLLFHCWLLCSLKLRLFKVTLWPFVGLWLSWHRDRLIKHPSVGCRLAAAALLCPGVHKGGHWRSCSACGMLWHRMVGSIPTGGEVEPREGIWGMLTRT